MDQNEINKANRVGRERAEATRDGFIELHQRQKKTFDTQADRLDGFESRAGIQLDSMSRLRVYVSLIDPNLGVFISNAQSKAKSAYLTGTRNWHQNYDIDIANVDITLRGRAVHIKIRANDRFYFEFATTAKPVVTETITQLGVSIPSYRNCVVGVDVRANDKTIIATPRINQNKRGAIGLGGADVSLISRGQQVQLIDEPVYYPNATTKLGRIRTTETLFGAYGKSTSWTGVLSRATDGPFSPFGIPVTGGAQQTFFGRDLYYDVPFEDNYKLDPVRYAYIRGDADWPRTNGKQLVKDKTFGEREFVIYVDAYSQFAIFPTDAIGPLGNGGPDPYVQNVPEIYVQRFRPTLPAKYYVASERAREYWDTNPDMNQMIVDRPEVDWKFNHTGTRAAAVVIAREAFSYDSAFWATDPDPDQAYDTTKFATFTSWMGVQSNYVNGFRPETYNPTRYFCAPGVIELTFDIQLTGPDLNQYIATIKVDELRDPTVADTRCAVHVGYVWHNIPKRTNTNEVVKAGTLVAVDFEYWMQPRGAVGEDTRRQQLISLRALPSAADAAAGIAANKAATERELYSAVGAPVIGIDLATLSMVLRIDAYTIESKYCYNTAGSSAALKFPIHHFGAAIIHSGVLKEVLFPDGTPDEAKTLLNTYAAINGRQYFADVVNATSVDGPWELVALASAKDGYADPGIAAYRNWWPYQQWEGIEQWYAFIDTDIDVHGTFRLRMKYSATPPAYPADGDATVKWLSAIGGDFRNLLFCDSPRWGWHAYSTIVPGYWNVTALTCFFTHPNGTYAFYDDGWIYDKNGLPGDVVNGVGAGGSTGLGQGSGTDYTRNTLATYDISKVSQVIFDRVHFEVKAKDTPAKTHNTSFVELYNKAVKLGKDSGTLPDSEGLQPFLPDDLKAAFNKDIGFDSNVPNTFLDLKMTRYGREWWYRESAYASPNDSGFPNLVGTQGNFNALNIYSLWRDGPFATSTTSAIPGENSINDSTNWGYRFANAIVLMEK